MKKSIADLRVVTIGGGSGGYTLNLGLHAYPVHQTAICTAFDSGGSSGELRDQYGALPQGDVRRCMLAMAGNKDDTLRELLNFRFPEGNGPLSLAGHSLGNLMLFAGDKLWGHIAGIRRLSELLGVRGQILPVSTDDAELYARLSDGSTVKGEKAIDTRSLDDERSIVKVWLAPIAYVRREAEEAIALADVVVLGPGDLYTSIIPNLLVEGVADALAQSSAKVIYVSNLMTKWSETRDYDAARFVESILEYGIGRKKFDTVLVNTMQISADVQHRYIEKEKAAPVVFNQNVCRRLEEMTEKVDAGDFLSRSSLAGSKLVRHSSSKLARRIVEIARGS